MKSTLRVIESNNILSFFSDIEAHNIVSSEEEGRINKVVINLGNLYGESEEQRQEIRMEFLNEVFLGIEKQRKTLNELGLSGKDLKVFVREYSEIYDVYISKEKADNYTDKILGKDNKKACLSVYIEYTPYKYTPALYQVSYRNGFELDTNKRYSEDEILRLIESKEIVVRYNTSYNEHERKDFFCALDECLDIKDPNVRNFTIQNYPYIYKDLRESLTDEKLSKDKLRFRDNQLNILRDIDIFLNEMGKSHIEKASNFNEAHRNCLRKIIDIKAQK